MKALSLFLGLSALASAAARVDAEIPDQVRSPDGRSVIRFSSRGDGTGWKFAVLRRGRLAFEHLVPDAAEARYLKASWSPDSRVLLLAINRKAAEDLAVLELGGRRPKYTDLTRQDWLSAALYRALPYRAGHRNSAPVERVPWQTVHWDNSRRARLLYLHHGLGYDGRARLRLDWRHGRPRLHLLSIRESVPPRLWDQD